MWWIYEKENERSRRGTGEKETVRKGNWKEGEKRKKVTCIFFFFSWLVDFFSHWKHFFKKKKKKFKLMELDVQESASS